MFIYYVTFRIHNATVNGATYQQRYDELIKNGRTAAGGFWCGTTSFMLTESPLGTYDFGKQLAKGLSAQYDQLLVADPSDKSASCFGAVEDFEILKSFFPLIKKIG